MLIGALDTKGPEYAFVRDRLRAAGAAVIVIDAGVLGNPPFEPEIAAAEVARAAGVDLSALRFTREGSDTRAVALTTMARGAIEIVRGLRARGTCDGVMGMGGSGGSTVISAVLRSLPVGVPKLLVSTMASGDVSTYVGSSDICLVYPVTDVQGLNRVSRRVLANAALAMAGMVVLGGGETGEGSADRPLVALTMMGVTTPGVQRMQAGLEAAGFETIVFHSNGGGGRALEAMIEDGSIDGVIDATTSELTAELFGGVLSSGANRMEAAARRGIPQVVSTGALEVINFGPLATLPARWAAPGRSIIVHNSSITSVRLDAGEAAASGRVLASRVNASTGPVRVLMPRGGCTKYELPGGPWADPAVDRAMFDAIRGGLRDGIDCREVDGNLNDASFADEAVRTFLACWARQRALPAAGAAARD